MRLVEGERKMERRQMQLVRKRKTGRTVVERADWAEVPGQSSRRTRTRVEEPSKLFVRRKKVRTVRRQHPAMVLREVRRTWWEEEG